MSGDWTASLAAFEQASRWFAGAAALGRGHWDEPALGEWTVRDLVGHTGRALSTVEAYLDRPTAGVDAVSAVAYVRRAVGGDAAAVAERGREAGRGLGDDPPAAVAALVERVLPRVAAAGADDLVTTPVGGMRLRDYLPTRTLELVVHTCDLRAVVGEESPVPPLAGAAAFDLVGALAADAGTAGPLLRAATGRGGLPSGYTVL